MVNLFGLKRINRTSSQSKKVTSAELLLVQFALLTLNAGNCQIQFFVYFKASTSLGTRVQQGSWLSVLTI